MFLSTDGKLKYQIKQGPYGPYIVKTNLKSKKSFNISIPNGVELDNDTLSVALMEAIVDTPCMSLLN